MAALTDEDLERMAMEEILKESKRNAERAKEFGSLGWQNPGKSTNKRFLRNMLVSTLRNPLQKSRFNNERQSSDFERTVGRKRRRHSQEERQRSDSDRHSQEDRRRNDSDRHSQEDRQRNDSDRHSQEDRRRNSNERCSKSYRDIHERNKNSSGSSMNSYRKNNLREPYDPPSGDFRRFSSDRQSYEELQQRKYEKEDRNRTKHRANGGAFSFQRKESPEEIGDIYHEDYMEYIQNYKKHMNYYEKMEEHMQEKYARSYHSEEGGILEKEARVKEQESSSTKGEKMAQKIKKKRTWSGSSEYSGSDFSDEKNSKSRNHSLSPTRKKKSKHMRKGFKENYSKTKKEKKNSEVNNRGDSGGVNSPEVTVSVGDEHDSGAILECADVLKGNNSESSDTKSSQKAKGLQKKKSKHKKHKHKKHKKDKEGSYR